MKKIIAQKKRYGFTLVEILIVVIIISVGILTVLTSISNARTYIAKTRQKIIALNLAKEGVEQVFNIRNTNRQRREGKKEECRLKTNPLGDENNPGCEDDTRMQSGNYIILQTGTSQKYFMMSGGAGFTGLYIKNGIQATDKKYSLCESGSTRSPCPDQDAVSKEGKFFRQIQGLGLYKKDVAIQGGQALSCLNGNSAGCGDEGAKEYRFCVIVEANNAGVSTTKICSLITNFKK